MTKLTKAFIKEIKYAAMNNLPQPDFSQLEREAFEKAVKLWEEECSMTPEERNQRDIAVARNRISGAIGSGSKKGPDFSDLSPEAQLVAQDAWGKKRATVTNEKLLRNQAIRIIIGALTRGAKKPPLQDFPSQIREEAHALWHKKRARQTPAEVDRRCALERTRNALKNGCNKPNFGDLHTDVQIAAEKEWNAKGAGVSREEKEIKRAKMRIYPYVKSGLTPNLDGLSAPAQQVGLQKWAVLRAKKDAQDSIKDLLALEANQIWQEEAGSPMDLPNVTQQMLQSGPMTEYNPSLVTRDYSCQNGLTFTNDYSSHAGFSFTEGYQRQDGPYSGSNSDQVRMPFTQGYFQPTVAPSFLGGYQTLGELPFASDSQEQIGPSLMGDYQTQPGLPFRGDYQAPRALLFPSDYGVQTGLPNLEGHRVREGQLALNPFIEQERATPPFAKNPSPSGHKTWGNAFNFFVTNPSCERGSIPGSANDTFSDTSLHTGALPKVN